MMKLSGSVKSPNHFRDAGKICSLPRIGYHTNPFARCEASGAEMRARPLPPGPLKVSSIAPGSPVRGITVARPYPVVVPKGTGLPSCVVWPVLNSDHVNTYVVAAAGETARRTPTRALSRHRYCMKHPSRHVQCQR